MKKFLLILGGAVFGFTGFLVLVPIFFPPAPLALEEAPSLGAPITTTERTLLPETDSLYDIGTSSKAWRDGFFDQLCLTADTCKTAWPGSGAAPQVGTSSNETAGQLAYYTTTSGTPALISGVATGTISGSGISVTANRSAVGGPLVITNDGVLSISATAPLVNNVSTGAVSLTCNTASAAQVGCLSAANWSLFNNKISSSSLSATAPLNYSSVTGVFTIDNAAADGATKGAASFTAADFNASSGNISIDYTNGQASSGSAKGFLTAADWTTFNSKVSTTLTITVAGTANQITSSAGAQDLSANRTWTLSLPSHVIFPTSYVASLGSTTNATSTNFTATVLASTTALRVSNIPAALVVTGSGGLAAAYGGAACTNQVIEDLSILGAPTCVSINNGYWSGTDLSVANGGTGLSTFGGTNTVLYTTAADTLSSEAAFTYSPTLDRLTSVNASSTNATIATLLKIPSGANPSVLSLGELIIETTAASTSLRYHDGTAERAIYNIESKTIVVASSTLAYIGSFGAAGTTTLLVWNPLRPLTLVSAICRTDVGTAHVDFHDGTNHTNDVSCSTTGARTTLSANTTWTLDENFKVDVGRNATAPNTVTITLHYREDAD